MPNIQLLRDPGFIYDLYFLFNLKFNAANYINELDNGKSKEVNVKYYNELLAQFDDIPEDLFVFFHRIENGRTFMTTHYFVDYRSRFTSDFDFQFLVNELRDQSKIVRNMVRFYLYDLSDEEIDECCESSTKLFLSIRNSKYSGEEKSRLYEFFIDPSYYIDMLRYELIQKESALGEYYKNNYQKIIDTYNNTTLDILRDAAAELGDYDIVDSEGDLYVSHCLLNNYLIYSFIVDDTFLSILGCDCISTFGADKKKKYDEPKLDTFGNAIGDVSRAKILWFIWEKGEATCKDLEKAFDFSGSTSYHHITLMTRAGVLKTRNEGKTVYYSINRTYFDAVLGVLDKFTTHKSKL